MKTTKKELEKMDSFVDMLINEGAKKGIPFYVNLKNREKEKERNQYKKAMKKEVYEFICPVCFLDYIFNSEVDSVTKDEVNRIEDVLSGYFGFSVKGEQFFAYRNDFNNLGEDCVTLTALKND